MTERLFQFIWQFQYYNKGNLATATGEPLQIIQPGLLNTQQGPDFLNARIKCGDTVLAGSIELHLKAGDWLQHGHTGDKNYKNCVLHVVWENDRDTGLNIPVLELKERISRLLLSRYETMMNSRSFIPCEEHIHKVTSISFAAFKNRLLVERLQQKAGDILAALQQNTQHWEEVFWQKIARNFGATLNSDAFEKIASSLPVTIIGRHKHNIVQLEAMLMGQAGLLSENFTDSYATMLQKEYAFLQKKYRLLPVHFPVNFLRMRPANFPTVRLAQLAALVHKSSHLFSIIKYAENVQELYPLFDVTANDFWHYHYTFNEITSFKKKKLGRQMAVNIILNTVIPMLYAYGWYNNDEEFKDKALHWAGNLPAEKNHITTRFEALQVENKTAFDSQALIQLKNKYCNEKRCLHCVVGNKILKD